MEKFPDLQTSLNFQMFIAYRQVGTDTLSNIRKIDDYILLWVCYILLHFFKISYNMLQYFFNICFRNPEKNEKLINYEN